MRMAIPELGDNYLNPDIRLAKGRTFFEQCYAVSTKFKPYPHLFPSLRWYPGFAVGIQRARNTPLCQLRNGHAHFLVL